MSLHDANLSRGGNVLLAAFITIFLVHAAPAREASAIMKRTPIDTVGAAQPPVTATKTGTAHVGCIYTIYMTIKSTLDVCFPDKFPALQRHVDKWLPIMRRYIDQDVAQETRKFTNDEEDRAFENYRKHLDRNYCERAHPSMEQFSQKLTGNLTKTERGLEEMFRQPDEPGRNYGCL